MAMIAIEAPERGPDCPDYYQAVDLYVTDILAEYGQQVSQGKTNATVAVFHDITGPEAPGLSIVRYDPVVPKYSHDHSPVRPDQWSEDFSARERYCTTWSWNKQGDALPDMIHMRSPDVLYSEAAAGELLRALERHVKEDRLVVALKRHHRRLFFSRA
jgi:hypothetical protein